MENAIIEIRNWFRTNGIMDFEIFPDIPKDKQGSHIVYDCKEIDNLFEQMLNKYKSNESKENLLQKAN